MKIHGKSLREPTTLSLYLPRGDEEVIEIKAKAVLSYDEFHKLLPIPVPPIQIARGKGKQPNFQDPGYLAELENYGKRKSTWMILQSLTATPGLTWEQIDLSAPHTWDLFEKELTDSGFSDIERQRILTLVMDANCLNESKLEEARERFLSGQVSGDQVNLSSSPKTDQANTLSGEPANGSISAHQTLEKAGTN